MRNIGYKSGVTARKLSRFGILVILHFFAEEFSTDVSRLDDILLLSSKLYDIVLM